MKKVAILLALWALVLSLPVMASDFTSGTIKVDGIISDGEWDAAAWVELPCPKEDVSLTGRIKMMNDKDYIYLLAESVDNQIIDTIVQHWNGNLSLDCLEMWLATDPEGAKYVASYQADNVVHMSLDHLGNYCWDGDSRFQDGLQYAAKFDGNKTTVYEMAIPMVDCEDGDTIGMQFAFNDTDSQSGTRCGYLVLSDAMDNWWVSPKNLVTYTLAEYVEPVTEEDVTEVPETFDACILVAITAVVSAAGCVLSRKKR